MPPHETLREALGQVVSDLRREWRRERELIEAQAGQVVADLRSKVVELEQTVRAMVEAKLAQVKDGEPGRDGTDGKDGSDGAPGKDGTNGTDGTSVTLEGCEPLIKAQIALVAAEVAEAITAGWEKPKDGQSVTVDELAPVVEEAVQRAVSGLPVAKDGLDGKDGTDGKDGVDGQNGAPGKLTLVKAWSDKVHYESDVVAHAGSTFQALRDTAKAPPHEDWICIARGGADGRSFTPRGLFDAEAEYAELDVVALNGASFVARADKPGPCPGDGWFLLASQGKQGKPGPALKGDRGLPGPSVQSMSVDEQGLLIVQNADGSTATCDLYPLLSRLGN